MNAHVTGGCLCGDIRLVATGSPRRVGDLPLPRLPQASRRSVLRRRDLSAGRGDDRAAKRSDYNGRNFCPRCGSSVFARSGDEIEVHLGALDAPDQFAPTYECWADAAGGVVAGI